MTIPCSVTDDKYSLGLELKAEQRALIIEKMPRFADMKPWDRRALLVEFLAKKIKGDYGYITDVIDKDIEAQINEGLDNDDKWLWLQHTLIDRLSGRYEKEINEWLEEKLLEEI